MEVRVNKSLLFKIESFFEKLVLSFSINYAKSSIIANKKNINPFPTCIRICSGILRSAVGYNRCSSTVPS